MNLIEALKTGKRGIRRRGRTSWPMPTQHCETSSHTICDPRQGDWFDPNFYVEVIGVRTEDLLADDWEVKPEPREWWVCFPPGGEARVWHPHTHENLEPCGHCIKVREVLE